MDKFVESARITSDLAYKAQNAGKLAEAARLFTNAGLALLRIAVGDFPNVEAGVQFLVENNVAALLSDGAAANSRLIDSVRSGQTTSLELLGRYMYLVSSDIAALVGAPEAARKYGEVAAAKEVSGTRFWDAYADCHRKFLARQSFDAPALSTRGPEKYWLPYIELMALLVRDMDVDDKQREIEKLFAKRNSDKRFVDADGYEVEGSPQRQARWDFRLHALLGKTGA
jgi:hypothetical protein